MNTQKTITPEVLLLRNRLPQNVTDELSAREVAKDIVSFELPTYIDLPETERACIKYLLNSVLLELSHEDPQKQTLAALFEKYRNRDYRPGTCTDQYCELVTLAPQETINLARFRLCDKLMKYTLCEH